MLCSGNIKHIEADSDPNGVKPVNSPNQKQAYVCVFAKQVAMK